MAAAKAPDGSAAGSAAGGGAPQSSFRRRDHLLAVEQQVQRWWAEERVYEADAEPGREKFFVTFPYPYMNGRAHLGHAFSASKAEFAARFQRLLGKNVLWPFAFHCTGMPIAACADRLKREFRERSAATDEVQNQAAAAAAAAAAAENEPVEKEVGKFSSKKSKAVQKSGTSTSQFEIMKMLGIDEEDIPKFQDPYYWLEYFPPLCKSDIARLGVSVDWRRSFVTTDRNPYYDAFIRWQFNTLHRRGYVKFGMRPAVFSLGENQPCADHDRLAGEGVGPQEYTMIKLRVCPESRAPLLAAVTGWRDDGARAAAAELDIFFLAATLRPETMYGQTNCFVQPEGVYGLFAGMAHCPDGPSVGAGGADGGAAAGTTAAAGTMTSRTAAAGMAATGPAAAGTAAAASAPASSSPSVNSYGVRQVTLPLSDILCSQPDKSRFAVFVCSHRAARNMSVQGMVPCVAGVGGGGSGAGAAATPFCFGEISGRSLLNTLVRAPLSPFPAVPALPMFGVSMDKGTGIVTSVPSDSPDDWAALRDVREKPALRAKFGIPDAAVAGLEPVAVIAIPGFGAHAAVDACAARKIASQNDRAQLAEAKEDIYKRGFYEGRMAVGEFKGMPVQEAKPKIRDALVAAGDAFTYYEPEKLVLARSREECVVALCNQWYLDYGNESWTAAVMRHVKDPELFQTFSPTTQAQFEAVVDWLKGWACSRHYGLGSYLPWEVAQKTLVESLSDSTIYMAYYTIAHFLQGDLYGDSPGLLGARPEMITDAVFDYVFRQTEDVPPAPDAGASAASDSASWAKKLAQMRGEFSYWYPMNLRTSGKDLIGNHLTMALFNHAAIWPELQRETWPRGFFCNGFVLVNAEKMSKAAGNFLTVEQCVEEFSADATRIAMADAGDSLGDANFQKDTANAAIMKLHMFEAFVEEVVAAGGVAEGGDGGAVRAAAGAPASAAASAATAASGSAAAAAAAAFRTTSPTWADRSFDAHCSLLVQRAREAYEKMQFRDALKYAFFDFSSARDAYRNVCGPERMHLASARRWARLQAVLLAPIAPHICDFLLREKLGGPPLAAARWPQAEPDLALVQELEYLAAAVEDLRRQKEAALAAGKKRKGGRPAPAGAASAASAGAGAGAAAGTGAAGGAAGVPASAAGAASAAPAAAAAGSAATIFVASSFPPLQQTVLTVLRALLTRESPGGAELTFAADGPPPEYMPELKSRLAELVPDKKQLKEALGFAQFRVKTEIPLRGVRALDLTAPFDEAVVLKENIAYLKRALGVDQVEVVVVGGENSPAAEGAAATSDKARAAAPAKPTATFTERAAAAV